MRSDADVPALVAPQRVAIGLLGSCFVGWTTEVFLAGICFTAFVKYVKEGHVRKDTLGIKVVAISVFILNCAVAFSCATLIFEFGTTQSRTGVDLLSLNTLDSLQSALVGLVAFLTQGYFCRRSALLFESKARKWVFVTVVVTLMSASLGGAIASTYYDYYDGDSTGPIWKAMEELWMWCQCSVDVINSATLCYLLKTKVVGFNERTDNLLRKLIKLALETASYTAFVALGAAISQAVTNPDSYYTGALIYVFWVPLPSLYCLSLFTTLDSRDRLAKDLGTFTSASEKRPDLESPRPRAIVKAHREQRPHTVAVSTMSSGAPISRWHYELGSLAEEGELRVEQKKRSSWPLANGIEVWEEIVVRESGT